MKLKWTKCKGTLILMRLSDIDIKPFWMPMAWVVLRTIYDDLPSWYAYRFDASEEDGPYIGSYFDLYQAKQAAEAAISTA